MYSAGCIIGVKMDYASEFILCGIKINWTKHHISAFNYQATIIFVGKKTQQLVLTTCGFGYT